MITLAVEGSGGSELTYNLVKQSISVGAASQNDVVIRAPGVAPRHLIIQRNGKVFTFIGQNRQVVVLNGERRSRGVLRVGDRVRIGTATLVFKGMEEEEIAATSEVSNEIEAEVESDTATVAATEVKREPAPSKSRSEVVLYSEPHRLAEARQQLVEIFRPGVHNDLASPVRSFLANTFTDRQAMLALLDEDGKLEPIVAEWSGELPRLPTRTFDELESGGRYALLRLAARKLIIYPVEQGVLRTHAYLVVETRDEEQEDDEIICAELSRMLAVSWERFERSSALYGPWENQARQLLERQLSGTSQGLRLLRDSIIKAAKSSQPVLLCGHAGSGRMTSASLMAALHPAGELPVSMLMVRENAGDSLRQELFGSDDVPGLVQRARGGALVIREVHLLPLPVQQELAIMIRTDMETGFCSSVRWIATTQEDVMGLLNEEVLDGSLFNLFQHHMLRVPGLEERREDLPLLVIRLLEVAGTEQEKKVRGIELDTLTAMLSHTFEGQMTELIGEIRRLISATPDGEIVRGVVPAMAGGASLPASDSAEAATAALLGQNDLKVVIPAVERLIIDRVLRRTKGNQSKAARVLKLSRGALIAKMKEYEIPDYRYLRRK